MKRHGVGKAQKLLLELYGWLLSPIQGRHPAYGVVWHGQECKVTKVRLNPDTRRCERFWQELEAMTSLSTPPSLILNDHCQSLRVPPALPRPGCPGGQPQPPAGDGRERVAEAQPQGHLHYRSAFLHLPPSEEREEGQATESTSLLRSPSIRDSRQEDLRIEATSYPKQPGADLSRHRGKLRAELLSTSWA